MATITIPDELAERIRAEARGLGMPPDQRATEILDGAVAPGGNLKPQFLEEGLAKLRSFVVRIPCITHVSVSTPSEPYWWLKFQIDLRSRIAWHAVQNLGFVLNYISIEERLPTVFMPVSPPPYLNGGPEEFLSWAIEARLPFLDAGNIADILENRLPSPVEDEAQWIEDETEAE